MAQVLSMFGALDESLIQTYTRDILEGLEYLHTRVHGAGAVDVWCPRREPHTDLHPRHSRGVGVSPHEGAWRRCCRCLVPSTRASYRPTPATFSRGWSISTRGCMAQVLSMFGALDESLIQTYTR